MLYLVTDAISTRFLKGQLRYLSEHGFDVHLACAGAEERGTLRTEEDVTLHPLPLRRAPSPVDDVRALIEIVRLIRRLRPHIVNSSTPKAGLLGTVAAALCRVKVRVYVMRGLRFESSQGWGRQALRVLERVSTTFSTHVLCNSRSLLELATREGVLQSGKGEVLGAGSGNGVDSAWFAHSPDPARSRAELGLDPAQPAIGFLGRLTADKGIADLLSALLLVRREVPGAQLLVVGDVDATDPLDPATFDRLRGAAGVVQTGWLDDTRVAYAAVDVVCFPSYREGLPNVPLEAQASGVPVVGYAATGTVDAVRSGETGLLVPIGDVAGLGAAMCRLLNDEAERTRMGEAGKRWVERDFAPTAIWDRLRVRYMDWLT